MKIWSYCEYLDDLELNRIEYKCEDCDRKYDDEYWHCPNCGAKMKQIDRESREMAAADRSSNDY